MKRYLPFLIIFIVGAGAVTSGTLLYRAKRTQLAAAAPPQITLAPTSPTADTTGATPPHVRGQADATVTIEEFADFQCPPCAALAHNLHKFEQDLGGRLRIIFRHYPLQNHQNARPAALAAEAAALQGKFWEMHDLLYQSQPAWAKATEIRPLLNEYAGKLGLDLTRFAADMDNPETKARIAADQARATSLGVKQTPTMFLNNEVVPVASLNPQALRGLIEAALNKDKAP